jgi:hypothetical protein
VLLEGEGELEGRQLPPRRNLVLGGRHYHGPFELPKASRGRELVPGVGVSQLRLLFFLFTEALLLHTAHYNGALGLDSRVG